MVVRVPGAHPLRTRAAALVPSAGRAAETQHVDSAAGDQALHRAVLHVLADQGDGAELLLVVDQFEGVFTLCREADERSRFIRALVAAAHAEGSRCRVVLGVRADFHPHCTRHPELSEACGGAQVAMGPLTTDELRRAITGPADWPATGVTSPCCSTPTAVSWPPATPGECGCGSPPARAGRGPSARYPPSRAVLSSRKPRTPRPSARTAVCSSPAAGPATRRQRTGPAWAALGHHRSPAPPAAVDPSHQRHALGGLQPGRPHPRDRRTGRRPAPVTGSSTWRRR